MRIFKIAQASSIMYKGFNAPEDLLHLSVKNGAFLTPDPFIAHKEGEHVAAYKIMAGNYYYPDTFNLDSKDCKMVKHFVGKSKINCAKVLTDLLFHPTPEWVEYLRGRHYNGFINGNYIYLWDQNRVHYLGQFDFNANTVQKATKVAQSVLISCHRTSQEIFRIAHGLTVYHGSNERFRGFDMSKQQSGYYPGFYVTSNRELAATYGVFVAEFSVLDPSKFYVLRDNKAADDLKIKAREAGHNVNSASGYGEAEYLKATGYHGINRGKEYIVFDPSQSLKPVQKVELE